MRVPVMAIDPTLRHTGVALGYVEDGKPVVQGVHYICTENASTKTVRKNSDDLRCARELIEELGYLRAAHRPVVTMVEVPHGSQTARSSWTLGITLGIIAAFPLPVVELTAVEVKKAFAGDKKASKERMIQLATERHPDLEWLRHGGRLTLKNQHLADAVAVLHAGAQSTQYRELARMLEVTAA